jgi:hypothetical protein
MARQLFARLKASGRTVKFLQCDNAGEHQEDLRKLCHEECGIQLEFVAPYTPQHNGVLERCFATDGSRALAMMLDAQWDSEHQR